MKLIRIYSIILMIPTLVFAQNDSFMESTLETIEIASGKRTTVLKKTIHFEAPNWAPDGTYFIINSEGLLYKVSLDGTQMKQIQTGVIDACNNDHGISPNGQFLAVSHNDRSSDGWPSKIYTMDIDGGNQKLITTKSPSYWHGWSPDGNTLVYCASRNNQYDVYAIPSKGGEEVQLTDSKGLDDGPEYSPDGKYIYFNSYRTGTMEIWRMNSDGTNKVQITNDQYSNWFAHPSPDGKYLVFISYMEDQGESHPANKACMLRLYSLHDGSIKVLTKVFGGQGTINVPSWSPDSKHIAFVSYRINQQ